MAGTGFPSSISGGFAAHPAPETLHPQPSSVPNGQNASLNSFGRDAYQGPAQPQTTTMHEQFQQHARAGTPQNTNNLVDEELHNAGIRNSRSPAPPQARADDQNRGSGDGSKKAGFISRHPFIAGSLVGGAVLGTAGLIGGIFAGTEAEKFGVQHSFTEPTWPGAATNGGNSSLFVG